jgi:hypothetical protein
MTNGSTINQAEALRLHRVALANSPEAQHLLRELNGDGPIVLSRVEKAVTKLYIAFWPQGAATAIRQRLDDVEREIENRATLDVLINVSGRDPYNATITPMRREALTITLPADPAARDTALMRQSETHGISLTSLVTALCRDGLKRAEEDGIDLNPHFEAQRANINKQVRMRQHAFLNVMFPHMPLPANNIYFSQEKLADWVQETTASDAGRKAFCERLQAHLSEERVRLPIDAEREFILRVGEEPLLEQLQLGATLRHGNSI